jgi:hypothetical protein
MYVTNAPSTAIASYNIKASQFEYQQRVRADLHSAISRSLGTVTLQSINSKHRFGTGSLSLTTSYANLNPCLVRSPNTKLMPLKPQSWPHLFSSSPFRPQHFPRSHRNSPTTYRSPRIRANRGACPPLIGPHLGTRGEHLGEFPTHCKPHTTISSPPHSLSNHDPDPPTSLPHYPQHRPNIASSLYTATVPTSPPTAAQQISSYATATPPFSPTTYPIPNPLQNPASKSPTRPTSTPSPPVYYIPTRISHSPPTCLTMPIYPARRGGGDR